MKTVNAGYELILRDEERGCLKTIEIAGRNCYKSEGKITEDSAEPFVQGIIKRGHDAILEHGDMIFMVDDPKILDNVAEAVQIIGGRGQFDPRFDMTYNDFSRRYIVSGNIRAWRDLFKSGSIASAYFAPYFDKLYTQDIRNLDGMDEKDQRVHQLRYSDLVGNSEKHKHMRQTVRFTVDRGVSHEFVRHRAMSFAQESTRWCNYSADRFEKQITFVKPPFFRDDSIAYNAWVKACEYAEQYYFILIAEGYTPEEARAVLPNSLKTELIMTGNLLAWQDFFNKRAKDMTGRAHPQAREVAKPLWEMNLLLYPETIY